MIFVSSFLIFTLVQFLPLVQTNKLLYTFIHGAFATLFVYNFPDGKTLFGKTSFTYSEVVNFLTLALGGIAAIFLAVIVIMRRSTRKSKLIQESEYRYLEERMEYFEDLAFEMEDLYDELNELAELSEE